jgi:carboxylesterase
MTAPILPGAEPASFPGGPNGVLVLHGFTGNPTSMRALAEAIAAAGHTVELPLLPGHGTAVEDMLATRWSDWSAVAEAAYADLAVRCDRVAVVGLSMGGTLSAWLAGRHPETAAMAVVNPLIEAAPDDLVGPLRDMLAAGTEVLPGVGSDIAMPDVVESAYEGSPLAPLISLLEATQALQPLLGEIRCPVLVLTSTQDHVVPPSSSDVLAASVAGPVERVTLERSFHVATLDYDAAEIRTRTVEFLAKAFR